MKTPLNFNMKFLVTGVTGGLAGLIVKELLKQGHDVIGTSRSTERAEKLDFYNQIKFIIRINNIQLDSINFSKLKNNY